ncbi:Cof-type HAD-IIB family hydrolase [Treponema zioleckii]|uniref:Cof-type HAD-IIB family hydrolase n=1 Tax=Treponema zioleckii TaxID=331680 RepID=UPI00168B9B68|nr:Cof-type HAD-IIB family hydrolase [Treponema zioleckii]
MENISIILSDLDGTLFRDDKSISEFTKLTVASAQKKGILFGISTSRALTNASEFLGGIEPDILITNGGGLVHYKGKKIYDSGFSNEETRALIKNAFAVMGKDAVISLDNEKGLYSNSREELGDKFWTFNDFSDFSESAMKMCFKTRDKSVVEKIASCVGVENVDLLPFSDIPWFKITKIDATKEKGIEALCAHLKISPKKIASFGDDFTDIGMLKLCGRGIAMKNAIPEVKLAADEICLSNQEDGVAKWIEETGYAKPYTSDSRKLFKIGVNFSTEERNIVEWEVE